ncbi:hypothetical protein [Thioalkalivibrio sp. ALE28]|nr:hypothetical protein [Thioalkalivibrio sp. ALE28]
MAGHDPAFGEYEAILLNQVETYFFVVTPVEGPIKMIGPFVFSRRVDEFS